jgi:Icc-related predicted phosphoesterase
MENLKWLEKEISSYNGQKVVVITHHMPSYQFIDSKYKGFPGNSAFANHLEGLPKKYSNVKLWIFGHTHSSFDSELNGCRFVCNPRGYDSFGNPENKNFTKEKVI